MPDEMTAHKHRNDGIDALRGLSIISVILLHLYIRVPLDLTSIDQIISLSITNILFRSGYYGVIVFFVISGFLITTTSLKRWEKLQSISYSQFYRMRFARIMPCLICLLMVLTLLDRLNITGFVIHTTSLSVAIFSALTFQINWLEAKTGYLPSNWDILWSLSVEEAFYVFFPLFCILLRKQTLFVLAMLGFILLGPFARTWTNNDIWCDHSYLSCMDGIAIGCLAALISYHFKLNKIKFLCILLTGLFLFIFILIFRKQAFEMGLSTIGLNVTLIEIGTGLLLISMQEWYVKGKRVGSIWTAPLRWLGRNSYEVYLTHPFLVIVISKTLMHFQPTKLVIGVSYLMTLALSGILGQYIARYFSEPMNQLLREKTQGYSKAILS
ncbi:TPA: acyltransferase [Legionella pneumophila]|nr:acyltransferase [Legionella pneumophila]MCO1452149.1 acyltransferase [Legionella pneumophila]MCZ4711513.1 acyltransferase [Legionella pneumophila]MDI0457667.1 acyltransferase [Legionella pneumophila]MDI0461301.1 acyltransferase [Legionella pneumophila]MDI2024939.1 acyltransferase [Legionella pneumophila]